MLGIGIWVAEFEFLCYFFCETLGCCLGFVRLGFGGFEVLDLVVGNYGR